MILDHEFLLCVMCYIHRLPHPRTDFTDVTKAQRDETTSLKPMSF